MALLLVDRLRLVFFFILTELCFLTNSFGSKTSIASHVASTPARTLQLILADPTRLHGPRWIVWDEGVGEGQSAHIALCAMSGVCTWSHIWPDAYEPTIQYMPAWSTKTPTFLVIYSQGAEAQTSVVVEVSRRGPPRLLDQHDGSWIAFIPDQNYLELNATSGAGQSVECLRWNKRLEHLQDVPCQRQIDDR